MDRADRCHIPAGARALAEDVNAFGDVPPGCERIATPEYVLWLNPRPGAVFTVVHRLRLSDDRVDGVVSEIRALLRDRGRLAATWEVGSSATPQNLVSRLTELGMIPYPAEAVSAAMVYVGPPIQMPAGVSSRAVATLAEYETAWRIMGAAFGASDADIDGTLALAASELDHELRGRGRRTYLAWLDGTPVAAATLKFTELGAVLNGGGTLTHARGRGAYRALVAARHADAMAAGAPGLAVQAGAMSLPILAALGFRETCRIRVLLDAIAPA